MKTIWFRKKTKFQKTKKMLSYTFSNISISYILLLTVAFSFFSWINNFSKTVDASASWFEMINESLEDLALYSWPINTQLSQAFLSLKSSIENYSDWKNVFETNEADIKLLINFLEDNYETVMWFDYLEDYTRFLEFLWKSLNYKDDIYQILWKDQKQKYIIALQNSNEARPNWGFFGSFILLEIKNWKIDYTIKDSYKVDAQDSIEKVDSPQRRQDNIADSRISFVSSNVLWFTDKDWENIIDIYESAFPEKSINWVIFLQSQLLEKMLPWFREKMRQWQFVNAAWRIMNKDNDDFQEKQVYMEQLNNYIQSNKYLLFQNFAKNFELVQDEWYVQAYFPDASDEFKNFLQENLLYTTFQEDIWYFWDFNYSYNKIDWFVEKYIKIKKDWEILKTTNFDRVDFDDFESGVYNIVIWYNLNVPSRYKTYIKELEKQYDVEMAEREKHILNFWYDFENMWLVYLPKELDILEVKTNPKAYRKFNTPYSTNIVYVLSWNENNKLHKIEFMIEL